MVVGHTHYWQIEHIKKIAYILNYDPDQPKPTGFFVCRWHEGILIWK